jgi:DNA-binding response OmpR family regulator
MMSLLIIDDDVEFCAALRDYLETYEIILHAEHDGETGLRAAHSASFEMILLDLMLPDMDGLEVLARLREFSSLRVLLLSAQGCESNRIAGLDEGADDFLPKPFNPRELVSRIRAILRRTENRAAFQQSHRPAGDDSPGLTIDVQARHASYRGMRIPLTDIEFSLLRIFISAPGVVHDRENLIETVLQRPFNPLDRSLDMHISRLRRKLTVIEEMVDPIKTIRNSGYLYSPVISTR